MSTPKPAAGPKHRKAQRGYAPRVVLAATRRRRSPEEVAKAALPGLARRLARVCLWPGEAPGEGWDLGEFRFAVLSFSPAPDIDLYVQWWSEPREAVSVEVCSGHANRSASPWITRVVRKDLRARGFRVGGAARNFVKKVPVGSRADVVGLAREALHVLTRELGYDGRAPLLMEVDAGTRAEPALVHTALTPDDVIKILAAVSLTGTLLPETDEQPTVAVPAKWPFSVSLSDRVAKENLYATLVFSAPLWAAPDEETLRRILLLVPGAQVVTVDDERRLAMTVALDGGVTTGFLFATVGRWLGALSALGEPVEAVLQNQPRLFDTSLVPGSTTTH